VKIKYWWSSLWLLVFGYLWINLWIFSTIRREAGKRKTAEPFNPPIPCHPEIYKGNREDICNRNCFTHQCQPQHAEEVFGKLSGEQLLGAK